jgi:hypothetical protein
MRALRRGKYFGSEVVKCAGCDRIGHPDYANKCDQCEDYICPDCGLFEVDGVWMCEQCKRDYRIDHPDMEEEIARAEYLYDARSDR